MDRISQLTHSVLDDIDNCSDLQTLENLRIKYLGKLEKIINQLKKENINLFFANDKWFIKTL